MTSPNHHRDAAEIKGKETALEFGDLPPGFLEIVRSEPDSRLARRFRGETNGNRSINDSALAYDLLPCGFTDNEISAVLRVNKHGRVWTYPCPDEYIAQAIAIARLSLTCLPYPGDG